MQYTIQNDKISVTVDTLGAELVSVKKDKKERLWQNPTGEWSGHAPILFPVCGHCGIIHEGVEYPIKAHGFSKKQNFVLTGQVCDELVFSLTSNEETKRVYPFDFLLEVRYQISGETLSIHYDVKNLSKEKPLYFACGSHEAYALDSDVDGYEIRFEKEENFLHFMHDNDGYLTGETKPFGMGNVLPLPIDFLQNGATLIFKDVNSRKVTLCEKGGKPLSDITFDGFGNLLLWRAGAGKFICIEPWTNLPDYANVPDKEFSQKDGVMQVEANGMKRMTRTIAFL